MLLVEQGKGRSKRSMPGESSGLVGIHFSVPGGGKEQHFRLEGKIVRTLQSGVGINFPNGMSDDAMTALLNFSNGVPLASVPPESQSTETDQTQAPANKPGSIKSASSAKPGSIASARATPRPASHPAAKSGRAPSAVPSTTPSAASSAAQVDPKAQPELRAAPRGPIQSGESQKVGGPGILA